MRKVQYDKSMVVRFGTGQPDALTTGWTSGVRIINSHVDSTVISVYQASALRSTLINIINRAMRRVRILSSTTVRWNGGR